MSEDSLYINIDQRGIAAVTLNRPKIHNAFDDRLIAEITQAFHALDANHEVRVIVLQSEGDSFSAGADINWMKRMAEYTHAENVDDARALAGMLEAIDKANKPTIAVVQGAALGGGVGLVAACDIAIASEKAIFGLTEVRLGIIPAVISPYVIAAMGTRAARRYFLTGERFDAQEAFRLGFIHMLTKPEELLDVKDKIIAELLKAGPKAISEAKQLIADVRLAAPGEELKELTASKIARLRASDEGKEGLSAFLNKRKPSWIRS